MSASTGPVLALAGEVRPRVLLVEDDAFVAQSLVAFLRAEGHEAVTASDAGQAIAALEHEAKLFEDRALGLAGALSGGRARVPGVREAPSVASDAGGAPTMLSPIGVAICDISLPGNDGLWLLRELRQRFPEIAVLMLTGYGSVETAVEALRAGATDYLTKPVMESELRMALSRALQQHELRAENVRLRTKLDAAEGLSGIVGGDPRMREIYQLVQAVAPSRTTVLMSGESGTGKSLIAHAIHRLSPRRDKPFVEISCGSIPETLLESELFGHVRGAFTGAHADKVGRFLAAHQGTIFLDEINSASPGMQLKLLRVLQERKFEPVGSTQTVEADVRVVLASNQPLEQLVAQGQFRQDLYYRIAVLKIEVPPLRDRSSDIPVLAGHFLAKHAAELGKQIVGFSPEAMDLLQRYAFPGNVRELQNIIERAAVLATSPTISVRELPSHVISPERSLVSIGSIGPGGASADGSRGVGSLPGSGSGSGSGLGAGLGVGANEPWTPTPLEEALRGPERSIILRALEANNWNRQKTADDLRINRTTLYKKMKAYNLAG
ncbi:MAG: sigma-54 dependent transcriptional regulator [Planctomycetota bacterium]|nr:sigma-54 dependent transcriptional regulator [Planctomycetota bacterium]